MKKRDIICEAIVAVVVILTGVLMAGVCREWYMRVIGCLISVAGGFLAILVDEMHWEVEKAEIEKELDEEEYHIPE